MLPSAPRKDEVRSKHSRIEIPTERLGSATIAKVSSGFDCKRVEDNLAMSVQQCLACNAVVSRLCLKDRHIIYFERYPLSTDFEYTCASTCLAKINNFTSP